MKKQNHQLNLDEKAIASTIESFAIEGIEVNPEDLNRKKELEERYSLDSFKKLHSRVKAIFIGHNDLLNILSHKSYLSGIPEDIVILGVNHDPMRRGFIMTVCSMDFPVHEEGESLKFIDVFEIEQVG